MGAEISAIEVGAAAVADSGTPTASTTRVRRCGGCGLPGAGRDLSAGAGRCGSEGGARGEGSSWGPGSGRNEGEGRGPGVSWSEGEGGGTGDSGNCSGCAGESRCERWREGDGRGSVVGGR